MRRNRFTVTPWTARFIACLVGVAFPALLEFGLRLAATPSRLDNILAVLRRDPELIWTQKPFLHENFFGTDVETDRLGLRKGAREARDRAGALRILTLGASPTFGWGVRAQETYAARLQERMTAAFGDRVEVVNGGVIGYSSHQGLGFLKRNWDVLRPDIITVAYVINDVDSYRFFRNNGLADKRLSAASGPLVAASDVLGGSALFKAMERLWSPLLGAVRGRDYAVYPGSVRVDLKDYRRNLAEFIDRARERGARVVFLKMPVNLPLGADPVSAWRARTAYREGLWLRDQGECVRASGFFRKAVEYDANLSRAYYYLGECARRGGRRLEAAEYLRQVKESESRRSARDALRYNAAMERVARERGVPSVDIVAAFQRRKGEYLFVDPARDTIHPNAAGHAIIGDALFERLRPIADAGISASPRKKQPRR